jgi:hypothetical protein
LTGVKGKSGRQKGSVDKYPREIRGIAKLSKDKKNIKKHIDLVRHRVHKNAVVTENGYVLVDSKGRMVRRKGRPETWDREGTISELVYILNTILSDPTIFTLGDVFEPLPFTSKDMQYVLHKFKDDEDVVDIWDKIKEVIENRLVRGGLNKNVDSTFTKFLLESKFEYQTKQIVENVTNQINFLGDGSSIIEEIRSKLMLNQPKNPDVIDITE